MILHIHTKTRTTSCGMITKYKVVSNLRSFTKSSLHMLNLVPLFIHHEIRPVKYHITIFLKIVFYAFMPNIFHLKHICLYILYLPRFPTLCCTRKNDTNIQLSLLNTFQRRSNILLFILHSMIENFLAIKSISLNLQKNYKEVHLVFTLNKFMQPICVGLKYVV